MTLDESTSPDDMLTDEHGVKLIAERKLAPYLDGAIVDYVESRFGSGFEIKTPNSGGDCGSGCSC